MVAKYIEAGKINLYYSLIYFSDFIFNALFIGLIIFIFINLWQAVYSGTSVIEGYTINMMIWYLVMTEALVISPGRVIEELGEEIQTGNIAQSLVKPVNFILYKYATNMGQTIIRFIITFIVGAAVALIFLGGIQVKVYSLPLLLIPIFLALTLNFLLMALVGIFTFWLEEATALSFVFSKIIFVIGGMLLPFEIFPQWLAKICQVLPFGFVAYHPAKLFVAFTLESFWKVIISQAAWIIILALIVSFTFRALSKKISINGG